MDKCFLLLHTYLWLFHYMTSVFKKNIRGVVYSFYRTTANDLVTYYVLFDGGNGTRKSFKIEMDEYGSWQLEGAGEGLKNLASQFIAIVVDNENPTP
jgi:hypothetical protein